MQRGGPRAEFAAAPVPYAVDMVRLSKRFQRQTRARSGYGTVKSAFLGLFRKAEAKPRVVTCAVDDLTLRIPQGASVGLIGRNGSGKSTLLKLITGIYKPDSGSLAVNGRIAALIELGAGFHPDFTGRENLYLAGIMHGLTRKEIDERFDTIVRFAELEAVIDDPVRTYSSGMFMRLGFSLAVHTDPQILIIDEVLAVGDASFVSKCKERIALLRREGKTLILVTHDMDAVERWCDEVLWLDKGIVKDRGDPRRVIDAYRQFIERGEELEREAERERAAREEAADPQAPAGGETTEATRWGGREIEITEARIRDSEGNERLVLRPHDAVVIEFDYVVRQEVPEPVFGIGINRTDGLVVHGTNTDLERVELGALPAKGTVRYLVERLGLLDGTYSLDVAVHAKDGYPYDYRKGALNFAVRAAGKGVGVYEPEHRWEVGPC